MMRLYLVLLLCIGMTKAEEGREMSLRVRSFIKAEAREAFSLTRESREGGKATLERRVQSSAELLSGWKADKNRREDGKEGDEAEEEIAIACFRSSDEWNGNKNSVGENVSQFTVGKKKYGEVRLQYL